jgi:hypothetical protein
MPLSRGAANLAPQRKSSRRERYDLAYLRPGFASGPILVCLAVASCVFSEVGCRASKTVEPSDQTLISTFRGHRQAFRQIQEMATDDMRRGWYLGTSSPNKLDQSRRNEYRSLISQIRPDLKVVTNGYTGVVRFIFAGEGSAVGPDWFKGIEYVPADVSGDVNREGILLPDLDKAAGLSANVYIRQIDPRWFIFYQRDE